MRRNTFPSSLYKEWVDNIWMRRTIYSPRATNSSIQFIKHLLCLQKCHNCMNWLFIHIKALPYNTLFPVLHLSYAHMLTRYNSYILQRIWIGRTSFHGKGFQGKFKLILKIQFLQEFTPSKTDDNMTFFMEKKVRLNTTWTCELSQW